MTGALGAARESGAAAFARAWARALHRAHYVPVSADERLAIVTGLTGRLVTGLLSEPFDPERGHAVGTDLVAAGFASPEALGRTITVVNTRLAACLGLAPEPSVCDRVTALLEGLATGFSAAAHDRSLRAQDAVRLAALTARADAERALRAHEARFRHFATHDALTGLPNRTLFVERLDRLGGAGTVRLGICCLDLDGFATVNDVLGHDVGDRLLARAADRLRSVAADGGHEVVRLGGDQFAILVEDTTCAEDAVKVADRALAVLAEPFHVDNTEVPLTASAGVVERPVGSGDTAEVLRAMQIALRWAKADGRARWRLFDPERSAAEAERYRLSAALPAALRRGEFTLAYQPLVDLADSRIVGVEALSRWRHPTRGLLGAGRYIDLAEHTGLIVPLGEHLLEMACWQAAVWQRRGPAPYVNVNVAVRQLQHPGFVGSVAQILDRTGLAPHRLQLEVTERAVIDLDDKVNRTLTALVALGVKIAIDDFGTGYSNLANLSAMPLHGLKLDARFVRPSRADGRDPEGRFLSTVVSLGHTLGLTVTAEGIETAGEAARMAAAGCDNGQGWYFGRPVPAEEITRRLHRQQP